MQTATLPFDEIEPVIAGHAVVGRVLRRQEVRPG